MSRSRDHRPQTHKSDRFRKACRAVSLAKADPSESDPGVRFRLCAGASPYQMLRMLLLLKRAVSQSSFQQPKNERDDRVDDELIKIDKKSRG
jgi:hypothetical protein